MLKWMLWMLLGWLVLSLPAARALEPENVLAFSYKRLILRPQLDLRVRYDSNLYYQEVDPQSDIYFEIAPGMELFLGERERHYFSCGYAYERPFYMDHSELNSDNQYITAGLQLKGDKLTLSGTDTISFINGVPSEGLNFISSLVQRLMFLDRYTLTYAATEKSSAYIAGQYDAIDYEDGTSLLDYNTLTGSFGFDYKMFGRSSLFGEVHYGQTATDPNIAGAPKSPHMTFIGGSLGARGEFTPRLQGQVKVGYEFREFSDESDAGGGIIVDTSLNYQMRQKTALSLTYRRRPNVSVQSGTSLYVQDSVYLEAQQALGTRGKWLARANAGTNLYDYRGNVFANRSESLYVFSGGVEYLIQLWLRAGLNYEFQTFTSNDAGVSDYDVHRLVLRLSVGY
jgi:hypothetical protein